MPNKIINFFQQKKKKIEKRMEVIQVNDGEWHDGE